MAVKTRTVTKKENSLLEIVMKNLSQPLKFQPRDSGRVYVSQAVCGRRAALISKESTMPEVIKSNSAQMQFYSEIGIAIEKVFLKGLEPVLKQYNIADDVLNLGGKIDGIRELNGNLEIVEVKSCGDLPVAPKIDHLSQAYIYSCITGIENYSIVYVSRMVVDKHDYRDRKMVWEEYNFVNEDEQLKYEQIYEIVKAIKYGENNLLPPRGRKMRNKTVCRGIYCEFVDKCWNDEEMILTNPALSSLDLLALEEEIEKTTNLVIQESRKKKLEIEQAYAEYVRIKRR